MNTNRTLATKQFYVCNCLKKAFDKFVVEFTPLILSVLKAWVGLFLVKIDMLSCWLHFSNTQQCVGTIYIL